MSMFAEEIARGAAFLDDWDPGWRDKVRVDRLAMSSCVTCVLGQLTGGRQECGWLEVCEQFGINEDSDQDSYLGFNVHPMSDNTAADYAILTREWREYILASRSESGASS